MGNMSPARLATWVTALGTARPEPPGLSFQSLGGVGLGCVLTRELPRLMRALMPLELEPPLPMRSGMASIAKAANEIAPSARATQGAHRPVSTWGIPGSRIRTKPNPIGRAWPERR